MIAEALRGRLSAWDGLSDETVATLIEALGPIDGVAGPIYAERRLGRFDKYTITCPNDPAEIDVWVPGAQTLIALVEMNDPPVFDVDALLDGLGVPEETQHNQRFRTGMLVDELAYPSRGLSLSVATPHADVGIDPPPRGRRQIVHVQLFRPTTVDDWRVRIGATVPVRPFPLR